MICARITRLLASTAAVALLAVASPALGQSPQSPTVAAGSIAVTRQGTTTVVTQGTDKGIIDWRSFSIGPQETVRFDQPGRSSVTLNRVASSDISRIDGNLSANGQVWISNPNGLMIGPGGQVNVGGLLATTGRVDATEFLKSGRATIDQIGKDAAIVNSGAVTVGDGGYAALAAASIRNDGVIAARSGSVALGVGKAMTLDFAGDKLIQYQVTQPLDQASAGADAAIVNNGTLAAEGGMVLLSARAAKGVMDNVINLKGLVISNKVSVDGGTVTLGDGGVVKVAAKIDASSATARGGTVSVLGEKVGLEDGASIDASGATGGGKVIVGGDWQGKGEPGAKGQNAKVAYVAPTAKINVDATRSGDGGVAVIWSDGATRFYGAIYARGAVTQGGATQGDGGKVETSGKAALVVGGQAVVSTAARAAAGRSGAWLLDPYDVTIATSGGIGSITNTYDPIANSIIAPSAIIGALGTGDVTILTTNAGTGGSGDIIVTDAISYSGTARTLTLNAYRDIVVNNTISGSGLGVNLISGRTIAVNAAINVSAGMKIALVADTITQTGGSFSTSGPGSTTIFRPLTASLVTAVDGGSSAGTLGLAGLISLVTGKVDIGGPGYTGLIQVGGSLVLTDDTGFQTAGAVVFNNVLDSPTSGPKAVKITAGAVTFGGDVGGTTRLASLDVAATTIMNAGNLDLTITTAGSQSYAGAMVFTGNNSGSSTNFQTAGGDITIAGSINSAGAAAKQAVAFNTGLSGGTGKVSLAGSIGVSAPVYAVTQNNTNSTMFVNGQIVSDGTQTYAGPVVANGAASFTSISQGVRFDSIVNGPGDLSVSSATETEFNDHVGYTPGAPLNSLTVTGVTRFANAADVVITAGTQSFGGAVVLTTDMLFDSPSSVLFNNPVTGVSPGNQSMQVLNASIVVLGGGAGTLITPLKSLAVSGVTTIGGDIFTQGQQIYGGNIALINNAMIGSAAGNISFIGAIDSGAGGPWNLNVGVSSGTVAFGGALGSVSPLQSLGVNSLGDVVIPIGSRLGAVGVVSQGDVTIKDASASLTLLPIYAGTGRIVTIDAAGAVSQLGQIIADTVVLANSGAASFSLTDANNAIGTLSGAADALTVVNWTATPLVIGGAGLTVTGALSLTQTGPQDLTINSAISAGSAYLSAGNQILAGTTAVSVSTGPLRVSAAGGGSLQNVTVSGNAGPVDSSFITVVSGSFNVNGVSAVPVVVTSPPAATTPTTATIVSAPSTPSVPSVATVASAPSTPSTVSVASTPTVPVVPTPVAPEVVVPIILADTRVVPPIFEQNPGVLPGLLLPPVVIQPPPPPPLPSPPVVQLNNANQAADTASGALIPMSAPTVGSTGASLASSQTIKVDGADTGGVGGQVIAVEGNGGSRTVFPGLVIQTGGPQRNAAQQVEPPLAQQPSTLNEEYFLD